MDSILGTILARKKEEVAALKKNRGFQRDLPVPPHRGFQAAIASGAALSIIAEVKKASPSKGIICADFDPVEIAKGYASGGAQACSVLTDEKFFMGSYEYLMAVRDAVSLPVIRKDFIIDLLQIEETVGMGADAMLLIAAALDDYQLRDLYQAALGAGVEPLIEVHDGRELDRTMKLDPVMIGINNRSLVTFVTDIKVTLDLVPHIPKSVTVVSESGIERGSQAHALKDAGVKALLVGESLMRSGTHCAALLKELMAES